MSTRILLIGGTNVDKNITNRGINVDGAPSGLGKGLIAPGRAREGVGSG